MKQLSLALLVALAGLVLLLLAPQASAGTCVIYLDQCFNSTYSTAGGGQLLVGGTNPDPRIAASATAEACEAAGGIWYNTENLDTISVCQPACCCNTQTQTGTVKAPALTCTSGTEQRAYSADDPLCSATCATEPPAVPPPCPEGPIGPDTCTCGSTPTTQSDMQLGYVCCWNGQIRSSMNSCPVKPDNYCEFNKVITASTACLCGSTMISSGVCCPGSIPQTQVEYCPVITPGDSGAVCGNSVREGNEQCDARYTYRLDGNQQIIWTPTGDHTCGEGNICSTTCTCVPLITAVCGDGICDASEATSCPLDCPSRTTCQAPYYSATNLAAAYSSEQVRLSWRHPTQCTDSRSQYRLQWSTSGRDAAINNPMGVITLGPEVQAYTHTSLPTTTTGIYYVLFTTYNGGANTATAEVQVFIPNSLCPSPGIYGYCLDARNGVNCNNYNVISQPACTGTGLQSGSSICGLVNGIATCIPAANTLQCESCNGLLSMFPDPSRQISFGAIITTCGQRASTCYLDTKETSVPLFQACAALDSCMGYRTSTACTENICGKGGPDGCSWYGSGPEMGYCAATQAAFNRCSDCTIQSGCTSNICEVELDKGCYFYESETTRNDLPNGCYAPEDVICEMYTSQQDCEGGTTFSLHTTYSSGARVAGNNTYSSLSSDVAALGKCTWFEPAGREAFCARDADDNNAPDLLLQATSTSLAMLRDFTNPRSAVIGTADTVYPANFDVRLGTEPGTLAYTCLSRPNDACYPNEQNLANNRFTTSFSGSEDNGAWVLRHYTEDASKNLEFVQEFRFLIDTEVPQIDVNLNQTFYTTSTNTTRAHVAVHIQVSEMAYCNTTLTTQEGTSIQGVRELQQLLSQPQGALGREFSYAYPQLADNNYRLRVTCSDLSRNQNITVVNFIVDSNNTIGNPQPAARTPPLNRTQVPINITTNANAQCRFGQRGDNWVQMTPYSVTGSTLHRHTVALPTGDYRFQTACDFGGTVIYGDLVDDILFSIDRLPPVVHLCDADRTQIGEGPCTSTPFNNTGAERHRVLLRCEDMPLDSPRFFCPPTNIFSCIENVTGTNTNCQPEQRNLHTVLGTVPVRLKYYAVDMGGNAGPVQTFLINLTDKTPPQITYTLLQ
jgi:hypothetical protein